MGYTVYDFLTTEASSSTTGGINTAEGQAPSTVNDGMRQLKQSLATFVDDQCGVNTVAGTADAITITAAQSWTAYATGLWLAFKAGSSNTGAATANVNGIGAKAIRRNGDSALSAGDIVSGGRYLLVYDAAYNTAAGAWVLLNAKPGSGDLLAANNLSDLANAATARTNLGLAIGTNVQAYDADLTTWGAKTAPSGTVVGNSDTQTLTNKTLTTPVFSGTPTGLDASTTAKGISEFATAAEFRTGTDTARSLVVDQVWASGAEVTLTDAATVTVDGATFINAVLTLGGNRTLGTWSNAKVGQSGYIRVVQDATGSRTLAYHADYEFAGGSAIVLSTTAAAQDMLFYQVIASGRVLLSAVKAIS